MDVIGDIHGCYDELCELFEVLGYHRKQDSYVHPEGRIPVFLGDITDRGPASIQVINLVYKMVVVKKLAKYTPGNHCNKLYRYFSGNNVKQQHGLETTVAEYKALDKTEQKKVKDQFMTLYKRAPLYLQIPDVHTIVAHAGIKEHFLGRTDKQVETFLLYGDITNKVDDNSRPARGDWAPSYHGTDWIVYGHTPVFEPCIVNKTINVDTGCVFGNMLTAFSLPEEKTFSVFSKQTLVKERFHLF